MRTFCNLSKSKSSQSTLEIPANNLFRDTFLITVNYFLLLKNPRDLAEFIFLYAKASISKKGRQVKL